MKKNTYYNNDVCVVGIGCVLPDSNDPREFWENVSQGNCSITKIPNQRWKSDLYFSLDKKAEDKTYSNTAASVKTEQLIKICEKFELDSTKINRLQIMALGATAQALGCLNPEALIEDKKKAAVFLGCMEIDEELTLEKFYLHEKESLQRYLEKNNLKNKEKILGEFQKHFFENVPSAENIISSKLTTSVISLIKKRFEIKGEGALIDAACASSLAAIDIAAKALRDYKINLAVTGGIESNLGPDTFVLFSKVGALSSGHCLPFDKKADGLSQGEGAAIFVLQRLEDAIREKNKIYGILKSFGSSSDGKKSSLFSPSVEGQVLAYERAYLGLDKKSVDYVECHGTGTKIGDGVEVSALNKFFEGRKIPIGSVKALVGHTKGAAGSAGLLKCLLSLQHKKIAPSKYLEKFIGQRGRGIYINKRPINLKNISKKIRFGISSFGFGNVNYHLVLDEFDIDCKIRNLEEKAKKTQVVILGKGSTSVEDINYDFIVNKFNVPMQSLSHIDKIQLGALLAVDAAFEKSNISINSLNKNEVSVISASCLGLDAAVELAYRIRHFEFVDAFNFLEKESLDLLIKHKGKFPAVSEDTGPGVLNNVIAGRVCNTFDFKGSNFNVDCDTNSFPAALNIAIAKLQETKGIVILLYLTDKTSEKEIAPAEKEINCIILSTVEYAKKNDYPICDIIKNVNYYEYN